jgi:hypothetical protein
VQNLRDQALRAVLDRWSEWANDQHHHADERRDNRQDAHVLDRVLTALVAEQVTGGTADARHNRQLA